jgi:hypothetical protein
VYIGVYITILVDTGFALSDCLYLIAFNLLGAGDDDLIYCSDFAPALLRGMKTSSLFLTHACLATCSFCCNHRTCHFKSLTSTSTSFPRHLPSVSILQSFTILVVSALLSHPYNLVGCYEKNPGARRLRLPPLATTYRELSSSQSAVPPSRRRWIPHV